MKLKFGLTNIFLLTLIFASNCFIYLTQMNCIRQPVKMLVVLGCILSFLSLIISLYNYIREDKD